VLRRKQQQVRRLRQGFGLGGGDLPGTQQGVDRV